MTLRRVLVLIRGLPGDCRFWQTVRAADEKALKPTPQQIRDRAKKYPLNEP